MTDDQRTFFQFLDIALTVIVALLLCHAARTYLSFSSIKNSLLRRLASASVESLIGITICAITCGILPFSLTVSSFFIVWTMLIVHKFLDRQIIKLSDRLGGK